GELRERRRFVLPALAGAGGMLIPILIYLAINAGHASTHGWGTAMSTDTAFALGLLALVGPAFPERLRAYLLTFSVVDDIIALFVIAFVYSGSISTSYLGMGIAVYAVILSVRAAHLSYGPIYFALGVTMWVALLKSGVDPIIVGLLIGVIALAYPAQRSDL